MIAPVPGKSVFALVLVGLVLGLGACADKTGTSADAAADDASADQRQLAVSADFTNHTLSVIDVDRLQAGKTRADALVGTVDLSAYSPGPMSLAITPDGKTALVSVSAGFIGLLNNVKTGVDKLLFIDLKTRKVTNELAIGSGPMGIAITPDGKQAFVGLLGDQQIAIVDIAKHTWKPLATGATFNEELAIDDSGTVGIFSYGSAGNVHTFSVSDPAGTLGQTTGLTGDAAGVAFFPGTKTAYLLQAPTPLTGNQGGHDLIDVTNPKMPVVSDTTLVAAAATTYPVTAVPSRDSIVFPETKDGMVSVVEVKLVKGVATEQQTISVGPGGLVPYGVCATRDGRVLVAEPSKHYVGVVNLKKGTAFTVPWDVTDVGPTEIKAIP